MSGIGLGIIFGNMINAVKFDMLDVLMWIGMAGAFEAIVSKYIDPEDINLKIMVYICLFLIALLIQYFFFPNTQEATFPNVYP